MIKDIVCRIYGKYNLLETNIKVYSNSYCDMGNTQLFMIRIGSKKYITVSGEGPIFEAFEGEFVEQSLKLCPLTHHNRLAINNYLAHTNPTAFGRNIPTFGVGDRLGIATPGHIKTFSKSTAKPILAQQSKRELELTGRTYRDVLDDVVFSVFQEGYKGGFGADGDHLKEEADVMDAIECGYTMITLDCSEKMGKGIDSLTIKDMENRYLKISQKTREYLENKYLNRIIKIGDNSIAYSKEELMKNVLIYYEAIQYVIYIYNKCLAKSKNPIDFEVSIDETESTTSEFGHHFVAREIIDAGVHLTSIAPRFAGEFQKGIDYIGDIKEFESHLKIHAAIADHFGYKLSIHSGSDKFSVFNLIGQYTKGRLHLKTSGTNWLEAVGTLAQCNYPLYRSVHKSALEYFQEARKFYHVTADLSKVPPIDSIEDDYLENYLKSEHARQLLHITYGFILREPKLKTAIYEYLSEHEELYISRLEKHIGRHLELIGLYEVEMGK